MNRAYFGDSYDVVKRFFCGELSALGYSVVAKPMFTGDWHGAEEAFLRFIGTPYAREEPPKAGRAALFIDPDTGVHRKASRQHVAISQLAEEASRYALVFAFDQSFSRRDSPDTAMRGKLQELADLGCRAMYYDSHARFLFVSRNGNTLAEFRNHVTQLGLPASRLVTSAH